MVDRFAVAAAEYRNEQVARRLLKSSASFVANFCPPDYLIDGILQRRFAYSMTAPTGAGKTAIALLLSASVALGLRLGSRQVEKGRVIYFAGENPDDIAMRWIAMADRMGFDIDSIQVYFVPGVFSIKEMKEKIRIEAEAIGDFAMIVVDTSAAYFEGADENDNKQMGGHARMLRALTTFQGGPAVLVLAHPVKNASSDNLLPRGGGAFVAEMDGNLTCTKDDSVTQLHWQGKFRGPDFDPLAFELLEVRSAQIKDSKGRPIPTVVASILGATEERSKEEMARSDEDSLLLAMRDHPGASMDRLAAELQWPHKSRVFRTMTRLHMDRLVEKKRKKWWLTKSGKDEAIRAETPV